MKSKFHLTDEEIIQIFKNYTQTPEKGYVVKVIEFSEEFEMKGVGYTEDIWGDLDEPVNKTFDRNPKVTFIPKDKPYVIVHSKNWPVYYLCCDKNKWYCLETCQYECIEKYITNVKLVTKDGIKPKEYKMEIKSITEMLKECNNDESELDKMFELPFYGKEGYNEQVSELEDIVNEYNSRLVPGSGRAKTVAGELIRAICRIYYRWLNDGDVIIPVINGGCSEYVNPSYCYIYAVLHDYARSTRDENYNESPIERFIEGELERFSVGTCECNFKDQGSHKEYTWHIHCLAKAILVCIKEFDLENVENKYDSRSFDENGDTGYFGYYSVEGSLYSMKCDKKKFEEIFGEGDEVAQHNFDAPNECLGLELNLQFLNGYRFKGEWSYNNCNGTCYLEGCMECKTKDWKGEVNNDYEQILLEFGNYHKYKDEDLFKYFKSLMEFINEHEDEAFEVHYDHPYHSTLEDKITEDELKLYRSKYEDSEDWIEFKTVELTQYILIKFDEVVFVLDKYKESEIIAAREKKEEKKDEQNI